MKQIWVISLLGLMAAFIVVPHASAVSQAVDPALFTVLERQVVIDQQIQEQGFTSLSQEKLEQILTTTLAAGSIPSTGAGLKKGADFVFVTGLDGRAVGEVGIAEYEVSVEPIKDVVMTLPYQRIVVGGEGGNTIDVAMKLTKGEREVKTTKYANYSLTFGQKLVLLVQKVLARAPFFKAKPQVSETALGGQRYEVRLYQDTNLNGFMDESEPLVPWANVKFNFKKLRDGREWVLSSGDNQLQFKKRPKNLTGAKKILEQVISGQNQVSITSQSSNQSITYKNGQIYGEDFPIHRGNVYNLNLIQPAKLVIVE